MSSLKLRFTLLFFLPLAVFGQHKSPKNIILMIGDGMGYNTVRATDYYNGGGGLVFESFPVKLAMATYPTKAGGYDEKNPGSNTWAQGYSTVQAWKDTAWLKRDYTESAAAATALATGVKTYNNSIGLSVNHDTLPNLTELAKSLGKSAGVVTSVPLSHATPAGFVAHNATRIHYAELAYSMLFDSRCDVIMGCGNPEFDGDGAPVNGKWKRASYVGDSALWVALKQGSGRETSFMAGGKQRTVKDCDGNGKPDSWTVITKRDDFQRLMSGKTPVRVLGVPQVYATLQSDRSMKNGETKDSPPGTTPLLTAVPTLAEMTAGALNVLDNNKRGFFVMVEGGAIDWANHGNKKGRMIEETNAFCDAVAEVVRWVEENSNWEETLLIVTADHETGLIWGERPFEPVKDNGKGNLPGLTFYSKDHSNSLVGLWGKGAGSELLTRFADEIDAVRGPFIQNTEIAQLVKFLWAK